MFLIYGTVILVILAIVFLLIGLFIKNRLFKYLGIIILSIIIIFWIGFFSWAMDDADDEYEKTVQDSSFNSGIEDLTNSFLNDEGIYRHGKITKISDDTIYFIDKNNDEYMLKNNINIDFVDGRTGEGYYFSDIQENYYIDLSYDLNCYIFKNIAGEELKNELLISLSLPDEVNMMRASVDEIKDVQQLGNNEAIVTFSISDIVSSEYFPCVNDAEHSFDVKLKVTNGTKYNTNFHGISAYNAETIENAKVDAMYYLRLYNTTLDYEYPEVSEFDSYSN